MEPLGDWVDIAPWKSRLLLIVNTNLLIQASTLTDKRAILGGETDSLVAVWPGQWSSSARRFAEGDADAVAAKLG